MNVRQGRLIMMMGFIGTVSDAQVKSLTRQAWNSALQAKP
jgi:hypothetical protein